MALTAELSCQPYDRQLRRRGTRWPAVENQLNIETSLTDSSVRPIHYNTRKTHENDAKEGFV